MPEGPEIWRTADSLHKSLAGEKITSLFFAFDNLKKFENELQDCKIKKVEARGKAILTFFEDKWVMYSHNQLYGKWLVRNHQNKPETNRTLRAAIHNESKSAYLYSASEIEMLLKDEVCEHSYIRKLGPDVLHSKIGYEDIIARYESEKFKNRKLTTLLLDQSFVSGIGNYLRSEIMFYAKIDPRKKLREYSDSEKKKLAKATITLSKRSYETGGITNDASIVEALRREDAKRGEYRHFVYNRTGKYCHRCGSEIEEDKTGGRKIYFCAFCQLDE